LRFLKYVDRDFGIHEKKIRSIADSSFDLIAVVGRRVLYAEP